MFKMEILDNSQHLNQLEDQTRNNFTSRSSPCELSPTATMNPMASTLRRTRGEDNDIGFLLQCKRELSSEVIRWKEENLSLQNINKANAKKLDELQQTIEKLSERNADLENHLLMTDKENEQLRLHSLAVDSENSILFRKLSQGMHKYHSFPWVESVHSVPFPHDAPHKTENSSEISQPRDWKEVSHNLFEQMKQEMKELQEMSNYLSIDDGACEDVKSPNSDFVKVENSIFTLSSKTKVLRKYLLNQRENLELLINNIGRGQTSVSNLASSTNSNADNKKNFLPVKHLPISKSIYDSNEESKGIPSRPSDESFRDYFTRQLQGKRSVEDMTAMMQLYVESKRKGVEEKDLQNSTFGCKTEPSTAVISQSCVSPSSETPMAQSSTQNTVLNTNATCNDEDRICPICEAVFPKIVPYKDFEAHVVEHLEIESASLLDQYVIL